MQLPAVPKDGKCIRANSVSGRLNDRERDCAGKRGINSIAALGQHRKTGLTGQGL